MHLSIDHFLFFSLLVLFFIPMRPHLLSSRLFELHSLPHNYLSFLGDSHLQYGGNGIALTKKAPRSTGMVLYSRPILFLDPHLKKVSSFSTMFAFSIENVYVNGKDSGDGFAFVISPDDRLLASPGYMGLVDSTDIERNKFIAIEFDTKCDPRFQDPDDNHLGFDINSLTSVQLATSSSLGISLESGDIIRTWIDYKGDERRLEVFLSDSDMKPVKPLLKVDIDLSKYLKENMFVGFSAATGESVQLTRIEQWEFTIVQFSPPPPSSAPESGRYSDLIRRAIGLTIAVWSVLFVVVFVWFCWKKLMGMIQKLERRNNLEMQTVRSSGGNSEIRLSIPGTNYDEIARGLTIEKMLDNEAELIHVKIVKLSISSVQQFATENR